MYPSVGERTYKKGPEQGSRKTSNILGLYRDNGKETWKLQGLGFRGLYWVYIGMEVSQN